MTNLTLRTVFALFVAVAVSACSDDSAHQSERVLGHQPIRPCGRRQRPTAGGAS